MKSSKIARFSLRSLLAAATLGVGIQSAQAVTLNYTANDLGTGRFVVDLYTPNNIGLGAGTWTYGAQPASTPTLTESFSSGVQDGSINFLNIKNGQLVSSVTGVSTNLYVYQAGLIAGNLAGATIFGAVVIPNVEVGTYEGFAISYNLHNPDTYNAALYLSNMTVNGTAGRDAVHSDIFVNSTLNLNGSNRINGATLVDDIYIDYYSDTTFNGNVSGRTMLVEGSVANYTSSANQINGNIVVPGYNVPNG